jgi:hypothetical protein
MSIFLATLAVVLLPVTFVAVGLACLFYGERKGMTRLLLDERKRERRGAREVRRWQEKVLERAGVGPLEPRLQPEPSIPRPRGRRIVPASAAINEQIKHDLGLVDGRPPDPPPPPPPGVGSAFLQDVGADVSTNHSPAQEGGQHGNTEHGGQE